MPDYPREYRALGESQLIGGLNGKCSTVTEIFKIIHRNFQNHSSKFSKSFIEISKIIHPLTLNCVTLRSNLCDNEY